MENYENKELLKDAAKKSLESLKDMKPGTDEYDKAANMALKLYDMQLKDEAQETEKQLKRTSSCGRNTKSNSIRRKRRNRASLSGQRSA